ncbi:MAG TPA: hypothetical protein ENJ00_08450 [Phycisphaerales bacterium]|nr:hypothetical protein [Phycisphaerales bacterium]
MRTLVGSACVVALVSGSALASPPVRKHIDPEAQWVVHLDLDALNDSEIGSWLMEQAAEDSDDFEDVRQVLPGFWPGPDGGLTGVTLYGQSLDMEEEQGWSSFAAIIYGDDRITDWGEQLEHAAEQDGAGDAVRHRTVNGHESWSIPMDDDARAYMALVEHGRRAAWVVTFAPGQLKHALGIVDDGSGGSELLEGGWDDGVIGFAGTLSLNSIDDDGGLTRILGDSVALAARVGEVDGEVTLEAAIDTGDEEKSQALMGIANGLVSAGVLASGQDEDLDRLMEVIGDVEMDVDGSLFVLSLTRDADEVIEFLESVDDGELLDGDFDDDDDWDDD